MYWSNPQLNTMFGCAGSLYHTHSYICSRQGPKSPVCGTLIPLFSAPPCVDTCSELQLPLSLSLLVAHSCPLASFIAGPCDASACGHPTCCAVYTYICSPAPGHSPHAAHADSTALAVSVREPIHAAHATPAAIPGQHRTARAASTARFDGFWGRQLHR